MSLASLLISGRDWMFPAAGLVLVALLLAVWAYYRGTAGAPLRSACLALRLLGIFALAFCLLEPLWSGQRARPGSNFFAVLADNSQGMRIKDRGEAVSRGEWLHRFLTSDQSTWLNQLEETFQLRRYFFDSRLQNTRDFSELDFNGPVSSIGAALRAVRERYQGQPLAGILMFTDGNATDIPDGRLDTSGLPPIYPIVVGRDEAIKDISIQKVALSQTVFEDAPVTLQADVAAGGYSGGIVAQILDPEGKIVAEQSQTVPRDGAAQAYRFQIKPVKSGISFYQLRVAPKDETGQFEAPEKSSEATLANNQRVMVVDRGKGPYRILYVCGRPNWEFKFLNRAVAEDDQVELVALIRIARREPKFEFRGRAGESSNPLYRGFDRKTEETERYDQPVLVRLNTKDAAELLGGFPKTEEDLYGYHALILDDLEAEFFTHDQMSLVQRFVSERGGGFLMLGGAESFQAGKFNRTPVGDMLPVYLDGAPQSRPLTNLHLALTREGWLQPWLRLRGTEGEEQSRLEAMPPFQVMNRVRDLKPGATAVALARDDAGTEYPAVVAQRFGNGRVGAIMIGDLWHWGLRDESTRKDMDKAWRQMVRWLVADVPNRIDFRAAPKRDDPNQALQLEVRARDQKFHPLDNATVTITVRPAAGTGSADRIGANSGTLTNGIRLAAEPALNEAGVYHATYLPREPGGYLAEATVIDANGLEVGRAETGWTADPAAEEFRSLRPNRALLEALARQTGGEVIATSRLEDFAARLPNRKAPINESWSYPLWHQPSVFLFALACFIAEWGLRRWKGMA